MPHIPPHDANWRKASRTNATGTNCVEVADLEPEIAVRDSQQREGGLLLASPNDWTGFISAIKQDTLDR